MEESEVTELALEHSTVSQQVDFTHRIVMTFTAFTADDFVLITTNNEIYTYGS